ncbi:MAG: class I SAM-dependent methyltransferase [bacterium]
MGETEHRVIEDPKWGFRRLDPPPGAEVLSEFYESHYADLLRRGERAPDVARLLAGGAEAETEAEWLADTLYSDILAVLEEHIEAAVPRRLLDVGSGTGEFLRFLKQNGWQGVGVEPATEIAAVAQERGLKVFPTTLEGFLETEGRKDDDRFSAVSLLNVLEHVPSPVEYLNLLKKALAPGGLLVVRVPNDFNPLQLAAQKALGKEPWWIAIPDHVSYFSYESLTRLLERLGFHLMYLQGDFPMEMFLLMGRDYVGNPELGSECHQERRQFELALPPETRRSWYRALARAGLGRNLLAVARVEAA